MPGMEQTQAGKKPAGITVSAVLALLGSLLTFGFCALMAFSLAVAGSRGTLPVDARLGLIVAIGMFSVLGVWGTTTSIGLFRLRNWARISIVVFAVLLAVVGLSAAPIIMLMPQPPNVPPLYGTVRIVMAVFYGLLGLLGVFWVYYFYRRSTRDVFGAVSSAQSGGRPLSISIIGWFFLVSGVVSFLLSPLRMPTALLFWIMSGWSAAAWYVVFGSIYAACGYGLLKLWPAARGWAIAMLCFGLVNGTVFFGLPGSDSRMAALTSRYRFGAQAPPPMPYFTHLILIPSAIAVAVPLWFLIKRRSAFYPSEGFRDLVIL